jgi:hypothetical protein
MRIEHLLPKNPTTIDYAKLLEAKGIRIPGGYKPEEYITTKQMAVMLLPTMGLERGKFDEVKKGILDNYREKAIVVDIQGIARYKAKETNEWRDLKYGFALTSDDTIKTEKNAKLILRVGQIGVVVIKENTILTLHNLSKEPVLYIEKGEILFDTHTPEKEKKPYYVITPTTLTGVRGTIFKKEVIEGKSRQVCFKGKLFEYEYAANFTKDEILDAIETGTLTELITADKWITLSQGFSYKEGKIVKASQSELESINAEDKESTTVADTLLLAGTAINYMENEGKLTKEAKDSYYDNNTQNFEEETTGEIIGPPSSEWSANPIVQEPFAKQPPLVEGGLPDDYEIYVLPSGEAYPDTDSSHTDKYAGGTGTGTVIQPVLPDPTGKPEGLTQPTPPPPSSGGGSSSSSSSSSTSYYWIDPVNGSNSNDGEQSRPWKTLTYALTQVPDGSTINLVTGTYNIASGETFPIQINRGNITIKGTNVVNGDGSVGRCVIDAVGMAPSLMGGVILVYDPASADAPPNITLDSLYITNGNATLASGAGGGIYISDGASNCNILNCVISGNTADLMGAGVYTISPANITNCTIYSNSLVNPAGIGGGIYNATPAVAGSTIRNCIIHANGAEQIYDDGSGILPTIAYNYVNTLAAIGPIVWYDGTNYLNDIAGITALNSALAAAGKGGDNISTPTGPVPVFKNDIDLRLSQVASPCVTAGTTSGAPAVDIAGRARGISVAGAVSQGAWEAIAGDPPITGRVYDSVTGETISGPVIAIYNAGTNLRVGLTTSNPYTFNVDPGRYYIAVAKDGYAFPSQIAARTTSGDHGDVFTASESALNIDIPVDSDGWLEIEKTANKRRVSNGEIVTYNIKIQNKHWFKSIANAELVDEIVNGFKYAGGTTYKGAVKQDDPAISNRKAIFNLGTVSANTTTNLSYQVRVGVAVPPGKYKAEAFTRKSTTQAINSNKSAVSVEVVSDSLFTKGTIIGKVFEDINSNGKQDEGEKGIGGVRLATEYGVVVETDKDGKYHIADVPAGNHLVKVDPSTLPEGTRFTTDNPYFIRMTEGLIAKANFGLAPQGQSKESTVRGPQSTEKEEKLPQSPIHSLQSFLNQFFIVALGEGTVRNLGTSGNIEMAGEDDGYDDGLKVDGKLALYLKGKVLGKYLITASVDTDRRPYGKNSTKSLFKNLDPDKYYPVYGDASKVDYSAVNTQDVVYVLIEWDESFAKWGSFHTEMPLYNRTMSGGIVNYTSAGKTKFGDPWTKVKGFGALSRQKAAHDEFVGTGGSLYYLRNDNVIEGSEKLQVEVRDRIGKTVINRIILAEEKDYEIDYDTGRILLKKPLNSIQQQYVRSIISNDILMGERVFLVVDYEFLSDKISENAWGARASQQIGSHVRVGGQYVQEEKTGDPYQLASGDATIKINNETRIDGAYSHSKETQLGSGLSYDGGLTFSEQSDTQSDGRSGSAVNVSGTTKLFKNTDVFLSYGRQDPYFSATDTISTQGSEKYIAQIASKLAKNFSAGIEHITQRLYENTIGAITLGAQDVHTTTGILDYRKEKWDLRGEYQHQEVKNPATNFTYMGSMPLLSNDFVAGRVGYQFYKWLHPYLRGQVTVRGETNNQGTIGADIEVWEDTTINLAETVGNLGDSTTLGITTKITEETDAYANLEVGNNMMLGKYTRTTYGQSSQLDPNTRAYIEEDYSSYRENLLTGNILGYDKKVSDTFGFGLTYERSNIKNVARIIDRDAGSVKLSYLNPHFSPFGGEGVKADTKVEVRNDRSDKLADDEEKVRQWVTQNDLLWHMTRDLSLSGRGNWGWSRNLLTEKDLAEFYELGAGFSLRPVAWDWLNLLGKYSYLMNLPPESQLDFTDTTESRRHVYALEGIFDLCRYLQLVGKFAYRDMEEKVGARDWTQSGTYLCVARTNFHIMNNSEGKPFMFRGWDLGIEYRVLANNQIEDSKKGFLVELDKDIGNYLRMGVGYNFTDYDDDLRNEDKWDAKGWFVRVNGKY